MLLDTCKFSVLLKFGLVVYFKLACCSLAFVLWWKYSPGACQLLKYVLDIQKNVFYQISDILCVSWCGPLPAGLSEVQRCSWPSMRTTL